MPRGIYDRSIRRKKLDVDISELAAMYESGMTIDKISRETGIGRWTINSRLVAHGTKMRPRGLPPGTFSPEGNWDEYPLETYREPPCGSDSPFCGRLKRYFRHLDGLEGPRLNQKEKLLALWETIHDREIEDGEA